LRPARRAAYLCSVLDANRCHVFEAMSLWKKLFNSEEPNRVDYYEEGLQLMGVGKYHEALTSFRLALRDNPRDATVLQQIAITYTRIGMTDEAIKTYRTVLEKDPAASGAHYGIAFLMLKEGRNTDAIGHLRSFLNHPPHGPEAERHITHARETLAQLAGEARSTEAL
jgi:tetratricopeptide (TPR) repeat protein